MISKLPLPILGVNTFDDPVAIQDGQWQRLRNLAPRKTGIVGQRPSMSFAREVIPDSRFWDMRLFTASPSVAGYYNWAQRIRPQKFIFDPNYGELSMVAITTDTITVYNALVAGNVTLGAGITIMVNLPQILNNSGGLPVVQVAVLGECTTEPSLFTFNGLTYAFNGVSNGARIDPPIASLFYETVNYQKNDFGTANGAFNPAGACVVRNRVVYYKGNSLYWSDANAPLSVAPAGFPIVGTRDIYLGGEEIENITAVAELSTSTDGSPVQSVAAAWTRSHMYMLLGEPLSSTDGGNILGSMQINRLNIEAGCVAQATICRTPYGTVWCGKDDVWFMPFGQLPIRVGTKIRDTLLNQPVGMSYKLHADYYDGFYRLALFADGQGPGTYDPCGMQMWLDFRAGAPQNAESAHWYGPQVWVNTDSLTVGGGGSSAAPGPYGTYCMSRDTRGMGDGRLYGLQSFYLYGLGDAANSSGMSLCSFDTYDGRDTCAPQGFTSDPWQVGYSYAEGDRFVPTPTGPLASPVRTAPIWICTTGGVSGGSEPTWNAATATGIIADGTVTWKLKLWDGSYPMISYSLSLLQGANQIEFSALSKELTLGDPTKEKLLDGAEIGFWAAGSTQLAYNSHPKQDRVGRTLNVDNEQTADNETSGTTGDRVWQRKSLTPSPTTRFHGLSAAWECGQLAGIIITAGVNDTIQMYINTSLRTLTIAAGYYADLEGVAAAVKTAMLVFDASANYTIAVDSGYIRPLFGFRTGFSLQVVTDSRLAELFGYSPRQGGLAPAVAVSAPTFAYGYESPRAKLIPDFQFSDIKLRYRIFNRGPT